MSAQQKMVSMRKKARARRTHVLARRSGLPRLVVFRSNKSIYGHIVDDSAGKVVCGVSGLKQKETGVPMATAVGKALAEKAKSHGIESVVFDRNGYRYHGQVKALADGAREGGLLF